VTSRQDNKSVCLTTSFGVTPKLLQFWQLNNFEFIKAGSRVDTSSGKHSVIMAKPLTEDCTCRLRELLEIRLLHFQQVDWESEELAADIQKRLKNGVDGSYTFTETSKHIIRQQLTDFIDCKRSFNLSAAAIYSANKLLLESNKQKIAVPKMRMTIEKSENSLKTLSGGYISKRQKTILLESLRKSCEELLVFLL
jgi:tRNA(Met) C34 N-acetyltransferase TmcA